jgi:hypothetical protein
LRLGNGLETSMTTLQVGAVRLLVGRTAGIESLAVKRSSVLPPAHDEEGVLWIAEIVSAVLRVVELDSEVMPFLKGNPGIHPVKS